MKIPIGPSRGRDIHDVSVAELEAACDTVDERLCNDPKGTEKAHQRKTFVRAARDLLRRRKFPSGTYADTESANRALRDAAEVGYLISPSDQVAKVLEGTAIVISAVPVDVQLDTFEDDDDRARRVPGKSLLDRIAGQLGFSWDAPNCRRTDDNSHHFVRSFQAAGKLLGFDGNESEKQAHSEVDLQDNSPLFRKIQARHAGSNRWRIEIDRRRQSIVSHADTAARLRVIRQFGLRDTYLPSELAKAFFVARVQFTGQSEDAATRQVFAERIADRFLPARDRLFGAAGTR